jgi:hypothetical protein
MDFKFLEPIRHKGVKKLEIEVEEDKVTHFRLITNPRKLEELIQAELEVRTEIQLTLGSDFLTYGIDKFMLIFKELTGRSGERPISTLKYDVIRTKPEFMPGEERRVEELYYRKVNAPIKKFLNALGPRVRKVREMMKDTDQFIREEAQEVAAKEIVGRIKKTTEDFGFDFNSIAKTAGTLLGSVANVLGAPPVQKLEAPAAPEYHAAIRKKRIQRTMEIKPQLIIIQGGPTLQIMGGSGIDSSFDNINPELLYDTLHYFLLSKIPTSKKHLNTKEP